MLASHEGLLRNVLICVLIVVGAVCALTPIPAIVAWGWINVVERALIAKGAPLPDGRSFDRAILRAMLKIFIAVGTLYLVVHFASR